MISLILFTIHTSLFKPLNLDTIEYVTWNDDNAGELEFLAKQEQTYYNS